MRLVLRRQAKDDLDEAFHWYEERQSGLGRSFRNAVESALSSIRQHPSMYPRVDSLIRRAATNRFPFGVFYLIEGDTVRVVAVLHNARNPELWKQRT